jgi:hypothetical protein
LKDNKVKDAFVDELRGFYNLDDKNAHLTYIPMEARFNIRSISIPFLRRPRMKHPIHYFVLMFAFALIAPGLFAQTAYKSGGFSDHVNLGVYGEFFQMDQTSINLGGLGGRFTVNLTPHIQLEAEAGYDFSRVFTEQFNDGGGVQVSRTNLRKLDGLFGPKLLTNKGPVRLFLTAKGGAVAFGLDHRPATFDTFTSSVEDLRADNVIAVFYPGAGVEAFWGPIGLRLDVGDEIYFANHAHNNLRVTFGPTIRF